MSSLYASDPDVPPVKLDHLGRRRVESSRGPDGLPLTAAMPPAPVTSPDPGPSYADFLGSADFLGNADSDDEDSAERTG